MTLNDGLRALASPTRRAILRMLWHTERTSGDIALATGLSHPAASQHLRVLRRTDLVHVRVDGPRRWYRVHTGKLGELRAALDQFWAERPPGPKPASTQTPAPNRPRAAETPTAW